MKQKNRLPLFDSNFIFVFNFKFSPLIVVFFSFDFSQFKFDQVFCGHCPAKNPIYLTRKNLVQVNTSNTIVETQNCWICQLDTNSVSISLWIERKKRNCNDKKNNKLTNKQTNIITQQQLKTHQINSRLNSINSLYISTLQYKLQTIFKSIFIEEKNHNISIFGSLCTPKWKSILIHIPTKYFFSENNVATTKYNNRSWTKCRKTQNTSTFQKKQKKKEEKT